MDNNLINIDDLVRQRLGGGEERERSGAWMRMEELLEKENRRKPFGFLFWKRAMSYVGVLLLLAAISVGGFEVSNSFKGLGSAGKGTAPAPSLAGANSSDNEKAGATQGASQVASEKVQVSNENTSYDKTFIASENGSTATNTDHNTNRTTGNITTVNHSGKTGTTTTDRIAVNVEGAKPTNSVQHASDNNSRIGGVAVVDKNSTVEAKKANVSNERTPEMGNAVDPVPSATSHMAAVTNTNNTSHSHKTNAHSTNHSKPSHSSEQIAGTSGNHVKEHASGHTNKPFIVSGVAQNVPGDNLNGAEASTLLKQTTSVAKLPIGATPSVADVKKIPGHNVAANSTNTGMLAGVANMATKPIVHRNPKKGEKTTASNEAGDEEQSSAISSTANAVAVNNIHHKHFTPKNGSVSPKVDKSLGDNYPRTKQVIAMIKAPTKSRGGAGKGGRIAANGRSKGHLKTAIEKPGDKTNHVADPSVAQVDMAAKVNAIAGKKVIEKIVMHQTSTGVYPGRTLTRLDTISIDKTTIYSYKKEPVAVDKSTGDNGDKAGGAITANVSGTDKPSKETVKVSKAKTGNKKTDNKTSGAGKTGSGIAANTKGKKGNTVGGNKTSNSKNKTPDAVDNTVGASPASLTSGIADVPAGATTGIVAATDPVVTPPASSAIVPEASATAPLPAPAATVPAVAENKQNVIKRKKGSHMLENLSSMFNDVKYKISGIQFAPGLTAGINGTFFGPNSFKGFQFGLTGGFEIDEKWSFLTELKYYHRMNNNFSIKDTYYDVNKKDSIISSFSFSTLHSFELPVSIRYTVGHMSFFAGGNFLYTLGVNTGADPTPYQVTAISATAKTAPSIVESDFAARFGIGYLFGMSFNVAPNVSFDFRSTRTFWDNTKTSGAKTVSEQLYKSPSLQFSIGYRFGAGKDKE